MHIDWWTLALQAINVLILVWILGRFFYRPLADIIERRRAAAAKVLADASASRDALEAEKADIRAARAGFAAERDKLLADARRRLDEERKAVLQDASEHIETLRRENTAVLARERAAMERGLVEQASALAVEIARKLLVRLPPDAAIAFFLDALCAQIEALQPRTRESLAASAQSGALDITTASTLNEAQQRRCQAAIESVLGVKAKIAFKVDPQLIAGIELCGGALVLKNDWRSDLAQILDELKRDDGRQ